MLKVRNQESKVKAAASLPLVLLIGGLIVEIGIAGAFIAYYLNQSGYSVKLAAEAYAAAQSGIQDAMLRIVRNKNFSPSPNPYTITVGNRSAQVTVCKDTCVGTGKFQIISLGIAFNKRRQLEAILDINDQTGEVKIESIRETAL